MLLTSILEMTQLMVRNLTAAKRHYSQPRTCILTYCLSTQCFTSSMSLIELIYGSIDKFAASSIMSLCSSCSQLLFYSPACPLLWWFDLMRCDHAVLQGMWTSCLGRRLKVWGSLMSLRPIRWVCEPYAGVLYQHYSYYMRHTTSYFLHSSTIPILRTIEYLVYITVCRSCCVLSELGLMFIWKKCRNI